jgi:hypothetical protein
MLADVGWSKRPREKIPVEWAVNVATWGDPVTKEREPLQVEIVLTRKDKKQRSNFRILFAECDAWQLLDILNHKGLK